LWILSGERGGICIQGFDLNDKIPFAPWAFYHSADDELLLSLALSSWRDLPAFEVNSLR
jgi:hypothetical protein